jgi:hypothetical protein
VCGCFVVGVCLYAHVGVMWFGWGWLLWTSECLVLVGGVVFMVCLWWSEVVLLVVCCVCFVF